MKVIHIINSIAKSTGGPARSVPQTCSELTKHGIWVELITQKSDNMVQILENEHLTVTFRSIWKLFLIGSRLSNKNIDLIHLQHIWNPYIQVMAYWAYKKKIPYIITPRGMLEPWIIARNPWKKKVALFLYQKKAIQRATHIHATADLEAQNIQAMGFSNPISVIPNGIDLGEITRFKEQYGTQKMVFLSRIHPKKGIEILLEAWRNCDTTGWTLEIAGDGETSYISNLVQSAQDLKNVHFVGSVYDESKWTFLRSADFMVLPTHSENFGIVVAEALAVGVPVITTSGTPWQDLDDYNCGWCINLSVTNLEKTLVKAFNTPHKLVKTMGENGRQLVVEKYDLKAVGNKMAELYYTI